MNSFYTQESSYMKWKTNTLHSTYRIIKDPSNEKQVNITYQVMGRQKITQNIIHENSSRNIYLYIY